MNYFKKDIDKLNKRLYDFTIPEDSTLIDLDCLTWKEREVADRFGQILEKYGRTPPQDVLDANRDLIDAFYHFLWSRAFDFFQMIVTPIFCKTEVDKMLFQAKLIHAFRRVIYEVKQERRHTELCEEVFGEDWTNDDIELSDDDPRWAECAQRLKAWEDEVKAEEERDRTAFLAEQRLKREKTR